MTDGEAWLLSLGIPAALIALSSLLHRRFVMLPNTSIRGWQRHVTDNPGMDSLKALLSQGPLLGISDREPRHRHIYMIAATPPEEGWVAVRTEVKLFTLRPNYLPLVMGTQNELEDLIQRDKIAVLRPDRFSNRIGAAYFPASNRDSRPEDA